MNTCNVAVSAIHQVEYMETYKVIAFFEEDAREEWRDSELIDSVECRMIGSVTSK